MPNSQKIRPFCPSLALKAIDNKPLSYSLPSQGTSQPSQNRRPLTEWGRECSGKIRMWKLVLLRAVSLNSHANRNSVEMR